MHAVNNVITSMAPVYMRDKVNSGALSGVLNGFCYVGSTVSAYGLGTIAERWGWQPVFYLFLGLCCGCAILACVFAVLKKKKR